MRIRSLIGTISALMLLAGLWPRVALAGAFTYAATRKEIKVGILLVRNPQDEGRNVAPENPDPYTFYVMDMRTDLKPAGWDFVNPLAPKAVNATIRNRRPEYAAYQIGQPLTKNMAAYWEVPLAETSLESLLQFDLLFIHNHRPNTQFYPEEREKLRQLVDAGGQIWIEDCGDFSIDPALPFFLDVNFASGGGSGEAVVPPGARNHPLLTTPYYLTDAEISRLGDGKLEGGAHLTGLRGPNPTDLVPVVDNGAYPYIAVANYGAGLVVASSADASCAINDRVGLRVPGSSANSGPYSGENFQLAETEDLKFAYNLVATAFASSTYGKNVRRTGRSKEYLAPPVTKKWEKPIVSKLPTLVTSPTDVLQGPAPAIYKNVAFVCAADMNIYALDCDPYGDLDMDGNPDDGESGMNDPLNFWPDVVWHFPVQDATHLSTPTVVSVPNSNGGMDDIVYVAAITGSGSRIIALNAFPSMGAQLSSSPQVIATKDVPGIAIAGAVAYLPPTIELPPSNPTGTDPGTLFAVGSRSDGSGAVVRLNARTLDILSDPQGLQCEGVVPGSNYGAAPSVARIRDTATGATDLVLAAATKAPSLSGTGHLALYTYAVSNEQLVMDPKIDTTGQEFFTRFAPGSPEGTFAGVQMRIATVNSTPWLRLRYKGTDGKDYVWDPNSSNATATGEVQANVSAPGKIKIISLTPAPDFDAPIFADYALDTTRRLDNPQADFKRSAMMPMYPGRGVDRPSGAGSVAVDVDGTFYFGTTDQPGKSTPGSSSGGSVYAVQFVQRKRPTVRWKAAIEKIVGSTKVAVGSPVIGDGAVYQAVTDPGGGASMIIAFNTKKVFRYTAGSSVTLTAPISINQPDPFRDGVVNQPPGYTVDYATGEITITDFGACDATMPFNVSDRNLANQTFNLVGNLQDFATYIGVPGTIVDSPVLAGSVMYVLVRGGGSGAVYSIPVDGIKLGNPTLCDSGYLSAPGFEAGMAVAGGTVIVNGTRGIYGLYSPVTLVADNSRLIEIKDPPPTVAGAPAEAVWTCTSSYKLIPIQGGAQEGGVDAPHQVATSFRQPSMARRLNQTNMLVCDTGNNRVVEIDRAGREVWEATVFADPYGLLATGQPLSVNRPTDAIRWYSYDASSGVTMHTVIADMGNHRVISLRSPAAAGAWTITRHDLEWVSQSSVYGKNYDYRCIELLPPDATGKRGILAGIDNLALDKNGNELGDGGTLVVLDYTLATSGGANAARGAIVESYYTADAPDNSPSYRLRRLSSIQRFLIPGTGPDSGEHILMADGASVIDAHRTTDGKLVQWPTTFLGSDAPPGTFQPLSVRQIPTGEVVVTMGGDNGQVVRLVPDRNGGFQIKPLAGQVQVNSLPGSAGANDYLMQPTFADRAF